ncbi:hypothetical protein [Mesorhizobium sp. STM 4661]|uniref:hypothetical protein n=1 Tax=Mesorhizobium sp. STM 4661 TaxID=1297570 RepID=UPI00039F1C6F|nr:hypothetical protein [Mesorhizobium sp. STM 4661]
MTRLGILFISLAMALFCASSAFALDEKLEVKSRTLADEDFLRGNTMAGTPVTLTGYLSGPEGVDKLPVVVLLHGSDGPSSGAVWGWERFLNGMGIATLSLDSYTGRNLTQVSTDQSVLVNSHKSTMPTEPSIRSPPILGSTHRTSP